jgi:hypothetical protein
VKKVAVPLLAVVAVGLAGCGGSSGSSTKPVSGASPTASSSSAAHASLNGEQSKSPQQVLSDTKSALFNAQAVHVKGTVSAQGRSETLDVQFQGEDAAGSVTTSGITVNVVKTAGKVYLRAPEQFWLKTAGPAAAPKLANHWLVEPANMAGNVSSLTLQGIAASLNAADSPLKPNVTTGQVAGQPAVMVTQQDGSVLAVANTGAPLPLQVTNNGASKGILAFTDYGKTQTITPPAGAISPQQAAKAPTTSSA